MLLSLIRACVRAARQMRKQQPGAGAAEGSSSSDAPDDAIALRRRAPLDAAVEVLRGLTSASPSPVDFPVVARHVNPIAAAYQSLGLNAEATLVLKSLLTDRTIGPEAEDGNNPFNVNDVQARDKASYSLVVQGAVNEGDYVTAVDALRVMTEAGLYPNQRHLNAWTEVSERKTKHRTTRSWTKKRDESWLESVR
jgi:pentatricopeptide repeat protein